MKRSPISMDGHIGHPESRPVRSVRQRQDHERRVQRRFVGEDLLEARAGWKSRDAAVTTMLSLSAGRYWTPPPTVDADRPVDRRPGTAAAAASRCVMEPQVVDVDVSFSLVVSSASRPALIIEHARIDEVRLSFGLAAAQRGQHAARGRSRPTRGLRRAAGPADPEAERPAGDVRVVEDRVEPLRLVVVGIAVARRADERRSRADTSPCRSRPRRRQTAR